MFRKYARFSLMEAAVKRAGKRQDLTTSLSVLCQRMVGHRGGFSTIFGVKSVVAGALPGGVVTLSPARTVHVTNISRLIKKAARRVRGRMSVLLYGTTLDPSCRNPYTTTTFRALDMLHKVKPV